MKIILTVFIALTSLVNYAQVQCGTKVSKKNFLKNYVIQKSHNNDAAFYVKFHIVRKNNGNGNNVVSFADCESAFLEMQNKYSSINICFTSLGVDYVNKSKFYNYNDGKFDDLVLENVTSNAIDIYIIPKSSNSIGYRGRAADIIAKSLVVSYDALGNGSTLAHEVGHCLGLYHTHETFLCAESVDGSNCLSCGDLICDTPADPTLSASNTNNCLYVGGAGYAPMSNNLMSYADPVCRTTFTHGQGDFIINGVLPNSSVLQACLRPYTIGITNRNYPSQLFFNFPTTFNFNIVSDGQIIADQVYVHSNAEVVYLAGNEIRLKPGFRAISGSFFKAKIGETCPADFSKSIQNNHVHFQEEVQEINTPFLNHSIKTKFYPNPTNSSLNISLDDSFIGGQISVYDIMGKLMHQSVLNSTYTTLACFADFPVGIYQVIMTKGELMETQKVVKE